MSDDVPEQPYLVESPGAVRNVHGQIYTLGNQLDSDGTRRYAIWNLARSAYPLEVFPPSEEGWREAWSRFQLLESGKFVPSIGVTSARSTVGAPLTRAPLTGAWAVPVLKLLAALSAIGGLVLGVVILANSSAESCTSFLGQLDCSQGTSTTLVVAGLGTMVSGLIYFTLLWAIAAILEHVLSIRGAAGA